MCAYRIEGRDIVIDGFENGIAPSPFDGLGDVRNTNIISIPKEASVGFSTSSLTTATVAANVLSADSSAETITTSSASWVNGQAVVFAGGSLPAGIVAGTVYWIFAHAGGVFKIAVAPGSSSPVNITSDGTGTAASVDMGRPLHNCVDKNGVVYVIDHNGRVWYYNGSTNFFFAGNTTLTNANGNGIAYYQASPDPSTGDTGAGFIFAFRNNKVDYMPIASLGTWTYGWQTLARTAAGTANTHSSLLGQDNVVYFCNGNYVSSFFEKSTATAFDPSSSATFTWTESALQIPPVDTAQCLAELGTSLLVGGRLFKIYPWDRISPSFNFPIFLPESNVVKMLTVNTNTFIFMGVRGRIYTTNGTQAKLYAKVPDHISGTVEPYFSWGAAGFNKNQIYFGVTATTNAGVALTAYGGLWAIDTDTNAMRLVNILSYGTYLGYATTFVPLTAAGVTGSGFYVGWDSGASTYGMDVSSSSPYTNYESYIDSDMIPVGQFLNKRTFENIEFLLTKPLVSGESLKISYRQDLSQSFTQVGETTDIGALSDVYTMNFENVQWIQLRVSLKSTASTPSYVRLREIRIR